MIAIESEIEIEATCKNDAYIELSGLIHISAEINRRLKKKDLDIKLDAGQNLHDFLHDILCNLKKDRKFLLIGKPENNQIRGQRMIRAKS